MCKKDIFFYYFWSPIFESISTICPGLRPQPAAPVAQLLTAFGGSSTLATLAHYENYSGTHYCYFYSTHYYGSHYSHGGRQWTGSDTTAPLGRSTAADRSLPPT